MFSFHLKKRHMHTHVILNVSEYSERQKLFSEDADVSVFFNQEIYAFADNTYQLSQLQ